MTLDTLLPIPLCAHMYILSNRTRKEASVKKIAFLSQTLQKFVNSFFIFKKKVDFWPLMAFFKAFASLRLQRSHSSLEKCFFSLMKNAFTHFGVFTIRKILLHCHLTISLYVGLIIMIFVYIFLKYIIDSSWSEQ